MHVSRGAKVCKAANLLIDLLAGTEMPSTEVYRLAKENGISSRTLERAKLIVDAKSRPVNCLGVIKHYMSVPENMKGQKFEFTEPESNTTRNRTDLGLVSSDWISVASSYDGGSQYKIDIPARVSPGIGLAVPALPLSSIGDNRKLRVKIGMYEFEADENFPADRLAELLRELAVAGE